MPSSARKAARDTESYAQRTSSDGGIQLDRSKEARHSVPARLPGKWEQRGRERRSHMQTPRAQALLTNGERGKTALRALASCNPAAVAVPGSWAAQPAAPPPQSPCRRLVTRYILWASSRWGSFGAGHFLAMLSTKKCRQQQLSSTIRRFASRVATPSLHRGAVHVAHFASEAAASLHS